MADLGSLKKRFMEIDASLSQISEEELLHGQHEQLYPCFKMLDQIAAMEVDDREAEEIGNDGELQLAIARISRMKRQNGLRMEIKNAQAIIRSPSPWEELKQFEYYPNYIELARMESKGGDLSPGDRVVFLGSGPLPLTLVLLCAGHRIQGVGIEQCAEYADLSRRLIASLGLADHIRIIEGNHFNLPLREKCHLTMVGADAVPKDEIFSHLADRLEVGARLSYRIYEKGFRRLLDVQSNFPLPRGLTEYRRVRPNPPVNNTSVFVAKTG